MKHTYWQDDDGTRHFIMAAYSATEGDSEREVDESTSYIPGRVIERLFELQELMHDQGDKMSITDIVVDLVDDVVDVWLEDRRKKEGTI